MLTTNSAPHRVVVSLLVFKMSRIIMSIRDGRGGSPLMLLLLGRVQGVGVGFLGFWGGGMFFFFSFLLLYCIGLLVVGWIHAGC